MLQVEVIGHQWWWEFRYPQLGLVTANELHIPVGRTVAARMIRGDVLHSFWMPQFAGKRDVFPNRDHALWFTARSPAAYPGACAEFCGIQHGRMAFYVVAKRRPTSRPRWAVPSGRRAAARRFVPRDAGRRCDRAGTATRGSDGGARVDSCS